MGILPGRAGVRNETGKVETRDSQLREAIRRMTKYPLTQKVRRKRPRI